MLEPVLLLMKDLDKFEMIMQAEDYEEQQGVDLSQFFESTRGKIKDGVVSSWEAELRSRRLARLKTGETRAPSGGIIGSGNGSDEGGDAKRQKS